VPALAVAWWLAALSGLSIGVAAAPLLGSAASSAGLVFAGLAAAGLLALTAPRRVSKVASVVWLCLLGLASATLGAGIGGARVAAIDGGALDLSAGERVSVAGHVAAVPRRAHGKVAVRVDTPDGRLLVEAPEPVPELPVGRAVEAIGTVRDPSPWEESWLARLGIHTVLAAPEIELRAGRRGGVASLLDGIRSRAEAALGAGTDPARAALLRGFVLGQDDLIDEETVEEFRRSGLSHLLAVSGQNVVLLAVLAWPLLALLGLRLRSRLVATLVLIAVYVPIAGAGPSIQRAGVMGAAGVAAALASRPRSRAHVLLLATAVTLVLNPRATGDPGWQLSFAAVVGIMLWAGPLRNRLLPDDRSGGPTGHRLRDALADGVAVTTAATLATAPLIAHQFGVVSIASLPANLLALPAVAPVMWLGMLAGLAGQLPWLPTEPLTWLAGALAGYIAQVASWLAAPGWAQVDLSIEGPLVLVGAYAALGLAVALAFRWMSRRTRLRAGLALTAFAAVTLAVAAVALVGPAATNGTEPGAAAAPGGLRVSILDVGQGDAILLAPADGLPVLVDAGPAEADVADLLTQRGIEELAAVVATHPQSDHIGGIPDVLGSFSVDRFVFARASRSLRANAAASGTPTTSIGAGDALRSGSLRLRVLWPPPERLGADAGPRADPNGLSVVLLARWHEFELLMTGDAEAELAPIDPGPVEVLKVAHHGSEDAGLDRLLDETDPRLAVVSVGDDNPFGHPSPATLTELADHGVPVARTDLDGTLTIDVDLDGFSVQADG
jgi:competence protein ComEC